MAKTYLDIVKYMVEAKFTIDGMVEKPDIIGAVFGQTEGLLGDELDLRELQKNGKIGRIEIDAQQSGGKTYGKLHLPASLDRIETCILGAAVESVDRVGPYEATFSVEKIEDTRSEKRRKILDRAKDLVKNLLTSELPDSKELAELVQSEVKSSEITTYGPDKLPAGPDVGKASDVIIVEGRADVITLLRSNITNAIAIGGATSTVPQTIKNLCGEKEVTIFADGDRGGDMIIKTIISVSEVDFVTKAPDGKEVEELTRKEIIKAMRTRIPIDQYTGGKGRSGSGPSGGAHQQQPQRFSQRGPEQERRPEMERRPTPPLPSRPQMHEPPLDYRQEQIGLGRPMPPPRPERREERDDIGIARMEPEDVKASMVRSSEARPALESMVLTQLNNGLTELSGTIRCRFYDPVGNMIKEVPIRELYAAMQDTDNIYAIVLDGVITPRLVDQALQKGVKAIYGVKANPMQKTHPELLLYTKEQGKVA